MNHEPLSIRTSTQISFPSQKICNSCYKSFLPELNEFQTDRSTITMKKAENCIIFDIKCKDITAFRATMSSVIGFGKIYEKIYDLCKK
ncbi:MAG: KEOPS complex subunit Pcc1 [Promethearchaeia archaeon]